MSARVSFADLLKAGADKDKQRLNLKLASPVLPSDSKVIAPERDFNKRANSLERDALPSGLFPGASKAIYDALYVRTLGAVNATNKIQATRKQIINWSGIKNLKTVNTHLRKLEDNGLIKRSNFNGEQSGNYYEISLPTQPDLPYQNDPKTPTQTQPRPNPDLTRKSDLDQYQKLVWVGSGNLIENKGTYEIPKTFLKTKKNDDEPAALNTSDNEFFEGGILEVSADEILEKNGGWSLSDAGLGVIEKVIDEISKKLIGKKLKFTDNEKLKELAELLAMELEIAAARTDSISNIPAFLTEHLRRRLLGKPNVQTTNKFSDAKFAGESLSSDKTVNPIQPILEDYQAEPLTGQAKETVLKTMREYIAKGQREFVMSLQDTYTVEDWKWLSENLSAEVTENQSKN